VTFCQAGTRSGEARFNTFNPATRRMQVMEACKCLLYAGIGLNPAGGKFFSTHPDERPGPGDYPGYIDVWQIGGLSPAQICCCGTVVFSYADKKLFEINNPII
jgi:hypothetical protein